MIEDRTEEQKKGRHRKGDQALVDAVGAPPANVRASGSTMFPKKNWASPVSCQGIGRKAFKVVASLQRFIQQALRFIEFTTVELIQVMPT